MLAMDINHAYAAQFDVDLVLDATGYDPECAFDSARLQQVLSNLLSNAAKFSPPGGTVHLGIRRVGAMARVSIADSGPGIPVSFRSRIFSAFSQADASATRETGGTGLGLHISKQMMEKMSGDLDYFSIEGRGSTFWIDVPLTATTALAAPETAGARPSQLPHVLHVEDDGDFRTFIATALEGQVTVAHAGTLNEARSALRARAFDLILLDLSLADGNGLDLLDDVAVHHTGPVIVLTATESVVADERVSAALVKSRTPESRIVEAILAAVTLPVQSARRRGAKR
jgi:CheY-like chemotaxis protein